MSGHLQTLTCPDPDTGQPVAFAVEPNAPVAVEANATFAVETSAPFAVETNAPFAVEATDIGLQTLVPGVLPIRPIDRLIARATAPLEPKKPQRACDLGLFDFNARNQLDLFAQPMAAEPKSAQPMPSQSMPSQPMQAQPMPAQPMIAVPLTAQTECDR